MYFTGSAGGDYDAAPFDATPRDVADLDRITALLSSRGMNHPVADVLDLGCGFGRQLLQASTGASGRLVGVDGSQKHCEGARSLLSSVSTRTAIIHSDFADITAPQLGQFDAIYCLGTIFTVPPAIRDHLLSIAANCLRPGGFLLLSYYAGTAGYISMALGQYIRLLRVEGDDLPTGIARARSTLGALLGFGESAPANEAVIRQAEAVRAVPDVAMAHEGLGHGIQLQNTAAIAGALGQHGIEFHGYLDLDPQNFECPPGERLYRAETLDLLQGGYRYALFARNTA